MRRSLIILTVLIVIAMPVSFATPPVSISLSYDQVKGTLHVQAEHPSFNLEKSYVRLMNVYVNGTQVSTLNYFKQNDYNEFTDDVPLSARVGDTVKVDLFCTLGGEMAQDLIITKTGDPSSDQGGGQGSAKGE